MNSVSVHLRRFYILTSLSLPLSVVAITGVCHHRLIHVWTSDSSLALLTPRLVPFLFADTTLSAISRLLSPPSDGLSCYAVFLLLCPSHTHFVVVSKPCWVLQLPALILSQEISSVLLTLKLCLQKHCLVGPVLQKELRLKKAPPTLFPLSPALPAS